MFFKLVGSTRAIFWGVLIFFLLISIELPASTGSGATLSMGGGNALSLQFNAGENPEDFSVAVQLVIVMTLLSLAPSMIMLMTSFTRIVIVLGFVRNALGVASTPSNQIILGLALFLTLFIMGNVSEKLYNHALTPYFEGRLTSKEALALASDEIKTFMLKQTKPSDVEFFLRLGGNIDHGKTLPLQLVLPAFVLSELRTAFQMGFLLFVPFLLIDFLVASILMAMGMMMMPPAMIALPFKLLLFVLVDGWTLVVQSLIRSFNL